ncbi:MAG TPA: hypothetical protein VH764_12130 [Gemmatimonadales bacterium]|jgi:hypothetical protein
MKRNLLALAAVLACGGRPEGQRTGAAVEDTTAAPSSDMGTPSRDTAADTGSHEVQMRPHDGPMVPSKSDTAR